MLPISAIIPCYDDRATLGRAIESCIAQRNVAQIIVVDDASTDGTADVARVWAARDPRIALLRCASNGGVARARNWAALHATQPLLAFLDADDEYLPDALTSPAAYLEHRADAAAVRLDVEFAGFPPEIVTHPDFEQHAATLSCTVPSSLVIRRAAYLALGGFPMDEFFRIKGGEDGAFSWALATIFGNPRLVDAKRVRMHFHADIFAERYFRIRMGMWTVTDDEVAQSVEMSRRFVETASANVAQLRALGLAQHAAAPASRDPAR
ncbi:glycosyltransferase family 2 protein [Burkholderia guangdongensis]|uniref:glycosyltransferase family 2 protein n=1 Tax=Burkholderia guangdongensis TaxID=1792500 RepID=UPI0015C82F06|nr:glycosyltransferase family 2 protein [Burkholderia guangdongensis]